MINKMEEDLKFGLMDLNMMVNIVMVWNMVMDLSFLQINHNMLDNFIKIKSKEKENIHGMMERFIMDNG